MKGQQDTCSVFIPWPQERFTVLCIHWYHETLQCDTLTSKCIQQTTTVSLGVSTCCGVCVCMGAVQLINFRYKHINCTCTHLCHVGAQCYTHSCGMCGIGIRWLPGQVAQHHKLGLLYMFITASPLWVIYDVTNLTSWHGEARLYVILLVVSSKLVHTQEPLDGVVSPTTESTHPLPL